MIRLLSHPSLRSRLYPLADRTRVPAACAREVLGSGWPYGARSANIGSVTSEGHPYARFRRALERRSVASAWAAATELAHVSLADALALCLLLRDREPARYPRAAVRWLGRYCYEEKGVTPDEATLVAAHLAAFVADDPRPTAQSLAALLDAHGRREVATAVRRWYVDAAAGR